MVEVTYTAKFHLHFK